MSEKQTIVPEDGSGSEIPAPDESKPIDAKPVLGRTAARWVLAAGVVGGGLLLTAEIDKFNEARDTEAAIAQMDARINAGQSVTVLPGMVSFNDRAGKSYGDSSMTQITNPIIDTKNSLVLARGDGGELVAIPYSTGKDGTEARIFARGLPPDGGNMEDVLREELLVSTALEPEVVEGRVDDRGVPMSKYTYVPVQKDGVAIELRGDGSVGGLQTFDNNSGREPTEVVLPE